MKKNITFLTLLFIYNNLLACDFCGCYMGITPYDNQSSITLMYRYKSYNGYINSGQQNNLFPQNYRSSIHTIPNFDSKDIDIKNFNYRHGSNPTATKKTEVPQKTQKDYEIYSSAELRAKFYIQKRIEINAIVPFVMNSNRVDDKMEHVKGVGDITFFAGYHLISKIEEARFQHRLIIGAGVKLPTGNYYAKNDGNERIDFLLQSGTGSIDYMTYFNYIFAYKKLGFSMNTTYKINGANYYHEQIDNSITNYLNVFYKFRQDKTLKLFPSIQGYYEYTNGVYIDNVYEAGTRTKVLTGGVGVDFFYKNFSLNTSYQLPIYENKIGNNLATAGKLMAGVTYNFNQKKYLISSKN